MTIPSQAMPSRKSEQHANHAVRMNSSNEHNREPLDKIEEDIQERGI
jgi:hypothetical protein